MTDKKSAYDESDIRQLKPNEHIRLRPGLYVGGTDKNALHHLFHEVFDNSIDEAVAGHCDQIWITLRPNNELSIRDNGRGIPTKATSHGKSTLELFMTSIAVCGKGSSEDYHVSGGLHGVGISAVNALAAECSAEVARDGYLWRQTYQAGTPVTDVTQVRLLADDESTGTCITIQPDFSIFEPNEFDYEILADRAREVAYLIPNLTITLRDQREDTAREDIFHFADGLVGYIKHLNQVSSVIHAPFTAKMECNIESNGRDQYTKRVEVALQYTDTMDTNVVGYANTIRTTSGSHTDYLAEALLDIINSGLSEPFSIADIMPGLTAIVSIWHPHPSFESYTNIKLINPEVRRLIAVAVEAAIPTLRNEVERLTQKLLANRQTPKEHDA